MASLPLRFSLAPAALVVLAALASTGCFDAQPEDVAGGGGVETTEGNLASLVAASSPMGARVSLIPADFDPLRDTLPDSLTVLADAQGVYRFRGLAPGRYNLEAHNPFDGTRCFRPGVQIARGGGRIGGTDTLVAPGRLRLLWNGILRGVLTQPGRDFRLDLAGTAADSGGIILDSLPAGLLPPIAYAAAADSAPRVWTDSVRIEPGELVAVPVLEAWAHMATLTFDTTSLSPDSLGGYPLLVRLTSPEFPFQEVSPSGTDIRFTTVSGEVLRHAVESWDAAAGRADIWVRLPDAPHAGFGTLHMEWGNPAAVYQAGPVFDSLAGYTGLWHFNDRTSGGQGLLADAGPFGSRTTAVNLVPASLGVIGGAQRFDGLGAYAAAEANPARTAARLSVSAWIAPDTTGMVGGFTQGLPPVLWTLFSNWRESDTTGIRLRYIADYQEILLELGFDTSHTRVGTALPEIEDDEWHLVGATYDGIEVTIWFDGELLASREVEKGEGEEELPLPYPDYLIGASRAAGSETGREQFFTGAVDEVRLSRTVHMPAWHRMDFLTQKPGSVFLRFEKRR